jgi:hypothetical protein
LRYGAASGAPAASRGGCRTNLERWRNRQPPLAKRRRDHDSPPFRPTLPGRFGRAVGPSDNDGASTRLCATATMQRQSAIAARPRISPRDLSHVGQRAERPLGPHRAPGRVGCEVGVDLGRLLIAVAHASLQRPSDAPTVAAQRSRPSAHAAGARPARASVMPAVGGPVREKPTPARPATWPTRREPPGPRCLRRARPELRPGLRVEGCLRVAVIECPIHRRTTALSSSADTAAPPLSPPSRRAGDAVGAPIDRTHPNHRDAAKRVIFRARGATSRLRGRLRWWCAQARRSRHCSPARRPVRWECSRGVRFVMRLGWPP